MISALAGASRRTGATHLRAAAPPLQGRRLPRIGTSVAIASAVLVASAPGLLPRPAVTQALLTGTAVALALAVSWSIRRAIGGPSPVGVRPRAWTARVAMLTSVGAVYSNLLWQNRLRVEMNVETVSWTYAVDVVGGATCVALALTGIGLGALRALRALGGARSITILAIVGVLSYGLAAPALWSEMSTYFSKTNSMLSSAVSAPASVTRSGSTNSLVPWRSLGAEGRKFASGGLDPRSVRTYVGLDSAPTLDQRVDLAIAEMERAGAFARGVVVVAIPTGSGWVDENAVTGAERRFGGDVATVALQYSDKPSWATFLFAEDDARSSAEAIVRAVSARAANTRTPPNIIVYGQSLGAVAGSDAYLSLRQRDPRICGAVWAGPPTGSVNTTDATVLANSSDPAVAWSARLLWSAPNPATTRRDAPTPIWLPLVSFVQTSVDLAAALDVEGGHGHRYGTDQGTSMPRCRTR